jgi:hypothetical protein
MSERTRRLERLLGIRHLVEDLDRRTLAIASAAVLEVKAALGAQAASLSEAGEAARVSLDGGDRREWLLADAQAEVARWNQASLKLLLQAREAVIPPAMERFLGSRQEHEQLQFLVGAARQAERLDEDHKTQTIADDWFLRRRTRANSKRCK